MRSLDGSNVAVVGGAGFLGSHLVDHLAKDRGCRVTVIDNLVTGRREFVHPDARFDHADITISESYLYRLFKANKTDYVFNYAAEPYIPVSFERPKHVVDTNLTGAVNVINAAHEAGCEGILQVSSAEIYGDFVPHHSLVKQGNRIDEGVPVRPHSTYGASKAAVDFYVQCRWKEAQVPCIALRQFNCLGERETHPYVVPEVISQLCRGDGTRVYLGNNSFRDFLYAGDAVAVAAELMERGTFGEVYNLGSESGVHVYDLAEMVGKVMRLGRVLVMKEQSRVRPWEIWHLQSDNAKVREAVTRNGLPTRLDSLTPLTLALERTVEYFRDAGYKWAWER